MTELPITLDLAKQHLRLGDDSSFDSLVAEYLQMAFGIASDYTNRDLVSEFDAQSLPPAIKSAVLLLLGTLFDNESDALVGRSVSQLPLTAEKLLLPWRIHPYSVQEPYTVPDSRILPDTAVHCPILSYTVKHSLNNVRSPNRSAPLPRIAG